MPEVIQTLMLLLTSLLFAAAFVLGYRNMRQAQGDGEEGGASAAGLGGLPHDASIGPPARAAVGAALAVGAGLLIWRALSHGTLGLPVSDPFDAFLLLGLLLALVVIYFRWTRHLRSLSFFLLPMIVALLLIGLGLAQFGHGAGRHSYGSFWLILHVVTIAAGALCFAMGCVGGVVYLLADRQLKHKGMDQTHRWIGLPPLASMERFNSWMVYMGFPLLTVATVAGILRILQGRSASQISVSESSGAAMQIKIALGVLAWLVYLVLAHVPLNPRFRGRRAAWLLIIGFAMFIGAYIVSSWS